MQKIFIHSLKRWLITGSLVFGILMSYLGLSTALQTKADAAPTISITSPTPNQSISGTTFTISGMATPNSTVVLSSSGVSFSQTKSDGAGAWSVNVTTLPAGTNTISAKVIENPTYGYFLTTPDFANLVINRIRLSDNVINPGGGGWPIASVSAPLVFSASPTQEVLFGVNPIAPFFLPSKFVPSSGIAPADTASYPANPGAMLGAFSADGLKFYVPNEQLGTLSVIDVATNTQSGSIAIGGSPKTASSGSNGKIYVVNNNNLTQIINTATDTIETSFVAPCAGSNSSIQTSFSQDASYPYYFVTCKEDGAILKLNISDNSLVATFSVGLQPITALLSLDNKRLFFSSLVATPDADKVRVIDTTSGATVQTINLTAGALGIFPTSDFQKIYVSTPGAFDTTNLDIIDTSTYAVTPVPLSGIPGTVITLPTQAVRADVDVSFVLGAATATTAGKLAETGIIAVSTTLLLGLVLVSFVLLYTDYRKHKKPLKAVDPNVHYTFMHHVKVVSIPLLRYRLTFSVEKRRNNVIRF